MRGVYRLKANLTIGLTLRPFADVSFNRLQKLTISLTIRALILLIATSAFSRAIAQTTDTSLPPANTSATPAKTNSPQPATAKATEAKSADQPKDTTSDNPSVKTVKDADALVEAIKDALKKEDPDWALVIGIGSLVKGRETDYQNESNVIHASNLGRATPQLLTGVSFRANIPNIMRRYRVSDDSACKNPKPADKKCPELWQRRPWSGFVSLKFAPGASQVLNGYVIGGSFAITHYLNALIGFALTPVNEAAPGFRTTAAQFVQRQQAQGQDLNFDPAAMLKNAQNAFDGFPVTDSTGKLIYQGNPLTVHYRGGVVFGVSIPIYFGSVFK